MNDKIKSEKAKSYLDEKGYTMYGEPVICLRSATKAVIIAETEAEERHAKELQELRDKAVEALNYCYYFCQYQGFSCGGTCHQKEEFTKDFTQKLDEK